MPRKNISLIEACGIAQQECRDIANDYAINDFDLSDWDMYNDNEDGSSDGREYCLLPYHVYLLEEYDLDYGTINYSALDEEGCRCGIIRVVLPKEMNAEQRNYAAHELVKYLKIKGIDAEMPDGEVTVETLRTLRAMTPDLDPDAEPVHLYIRLEKPNNEYDDTGRLVFESSLNMSVNFEVFALNPKFTKFKNKAYIEIKVDFSPAKKWLVNKLSLHIIAKSDEIDKAVRKRIEEISGERAEHFVIRTPEDAWLMLNKLMTNPLPYGCLWTDKQYFPTTPAGEARKSKD